MVNKHVRRISGHRAPATEPAHPQNLRIAHDVARSNQHVSLVAVPLWRSRGPAVAAIEPAWNAVASTRWWNNAMAKHHGNNGLPGSYSCAPKTAR